MLIPTSVPNTQSVFEGRRFPDLITSRLLKAALAGASSPYSDAELAELAAHCTGQVVVTDVDRGFIDFVRVG